MQKYEKNAENKKENFAGFVGWWLWMDGREQKVGSRRCEGEQLAIGDGNFAPRLAISDGGFAVGWQFDKFDKFDKFMTLKKIASGRWGSEAIGY